MSDLPRWDRPRETTTQDMKEQGKQPILESDGMRTNDLLYETGYENPNIFRFTALLWIKV